jgi:hypothetical protein
MVICLSERALKRESRAMHALTTLLDLSYISRLMDYTSSVATM